MAGELADSRTGSEIVTSWKGVPLSAPTLFALPPGPATANILLFSNDSSSTLVGSALEHKMGEVASIKKQGYNRQASANSQVDVERWP